MKTAGAALVILALFPVAATDPAVRFEAGGVRVGDDLVVGSLLVVKDSLLVSGSAVEPIATEIAVWIGGNRSLVLEPGVRVRRDGGAFKLVTHAGRSLLIRGVAIRAPATLAVDDEGWTVEGTRFEGEKLHVGLASIKSERTAVKAVTPPVGSKAPAPKNRRSWNDNPLVLSEGADGPALRFLSQASPSGF